MKRTKGLHKKAQKFYDDITKSFELEFYHKELLLRACECIHRIEQAKAAIELSGPYFMDRYGQPREHPAHVTERSNKVILARLLRELGLDLENIDDNTRPPRGRGYA